MLYEPIAWMRTLHCRCAECLRSTHGRGAEWHDAGIDAPNDPLVDAIAAQLSWWLPKPEPYALPGNAQRLPESLAIAHAYRDACRVADDYSSKDPRVLPLLDAAREIKEQIKVDFEWKRCAARTDDLRRRVWRYEASPERRAWARAQQRDIERRAWRNRGCAVEIVGVEYANGHRVMTAEEPLLIFRSVDGTKTRLTVTVDEAGRITPTIGDLT